jgi:hypothetical protein
MNTSTPERFVANPKARLKDQFHEVARFKHLSLRTEQTYWDWTVRFLKFHREVFSGAGRKEESPHPGPLPIASQRGEGAGNGWKHPREMGSPEITRFLTHLAVARHVAVSTQISASMHSCFCIVRCRPNTKSRIGRVTVFNVRAGRVGCQHD